VIYKLGTLLGSVGHKVKIHEITPATGKERGDMEIKGWFIINLDRLIGLSESSLLGWFLEGSLIVIIKGSSQ
jgi:hypothetical protein